MQKFEPLTKAQLAKAVKELGYKSKAEAIELIVERLPWLTIPMGSRSTNCCAGTPNTPNATTTGLMANRLTKSATSEPCPKQYANCTDTPAAEFGPLALKAIRQQFVDRG